MPDQMTGVCPHCSGTGYRIIEREGLGYADRCDCARQKEEAGRLSRMRIPDRFASASFENYITQFGNNPVVGRHRSNASVAARRWPQDYLENKVLGRKVHGLLFIGPPGTGKTHLAVAALKEIVRRGVDGVFFEFLTLVKTIARSWDRKIAGKEEKDAFRTAVETEILVIDDLGAQRALDWAEDIITDIISARYNAMKPVIVTTNLPDPSLHSLLVPSEHGPGGMPRMAKSLAEVIGERSRSRLFEMCKVVDMTGIDDYRLLARDKQRNP